MTDKDYSKQLRESIRLLERRFGVLTEGDFNCCSISLAQCHALVEIGRAETISLNQLAMLLNLDNSTMSRTVNHLVNDNLVQRGIDPRDHRYVTISLTLQGQKIFKEVESNMNSYFQKLYQSIPEDKKLQVLDSLQVLANTLGKIQSDY